MKEWLRDLHINETLINFSEAILIIIITIIVQRIVRLIFNRFILRSSKILNNNPTKYTFLKHFISGCIILIGLALAIHTVPSLRSISVSLFAGAGILAAIIGFASQEAFSNIISGIFIVIFKPFRVNDRVNISNLYEGYIEDISLRHTVIRDFEHKRVIIPNQVISRETVINHNLVEDMICQHLYVGISYDSDMDLAMNIIREEAKKHPLYRDNRSEESIAEGKDPVMVRVVKYGDSSIDLKAWIWTDDPLSAFYLRTDLLYSIKKRFDAEGIEIPFPHRTLVFKNKPNTEPGNIES